MFEIDWARGFAYKGKKGWIIQANPKGLYIEVGGKMIFLTQKNTKTIETFEDGYEPANQ